jgi:microcystin-dependent protein
MFCDGRQLPVVAYQALYAVIGNLYGGTPPTNFNLPNLQCRAPVGASTYAPGLTTYTAGQTLGQYAVTAAASQMPAHRHDWLVGVGVNGITSVPSTAVMPGRENLPSIVAYAPASSPLTTFGNVIGVAGSGPAPHENRQPCTVLNFCICYDGIFPVSD